MRKMKKPEIKIGLIITECANNYRDKELKKKFDESINFIEKYSEKFDQEMLNHNIHSLNPQDNVNTILKKEDMVKLYTDKFTKKSQGGRKYYDILMVSAENGQCPFCGVRLVATLDHFLPKNLFPALTVSPLNLVPACRDCNSSKGEKQFLCYEDTHLHPYYDNIENEIWLEAEVIIDSSSEIVVLYKVIKPDLWDGSLFERVKNHFELFDLQKLFSYQAMDEITSVKYKLKQLKKFAGVEALYEDLFDSLKSCERITLNGWKPALYRTLYKNKWFVETYL